MDTPKPVMMTAAEAPEEPPPIGQATVIVYEMERGQTQLLITWPDEAVGETEKAAAKRAEFVSFMQAEMNTFLNY